MDSNYYKTKLVTTVLKHFPYRVLWKHEDGIRAGYEDFADLKQAKIYKQKFNHVI